MQSETSMRTQALASSLYLPTARSGAAKALALALLVCASHSITPLAAASGTASVEAGFRVMADGRSGNCLSCHALPGQTGIPSTLGPALDKVGSRYDAVTLRQWVSDARSLKPGTLMPPFGSLEGTLLSSPAKPILTAGQIEQVVEALKTLR